MYNIVFNYTPNIGHDVLIAIYTYNVAIISCELKTFIVERSLAKFPAKRKKENR